METPRPMTIDEAAAYLQISPKKLSEKAAKGIVPAYKPFKSWLFFASELEQFIKSQKATPIRMNVSRPSLSIARSAANVTCELDELLAPRSARRRANP